MSEDYPAPLAGLRAGSQIAGYRLELQVGAGGMAVVFRARDERLGRLVALKLIGPAMASDPAIRRRFIAESRAAALVDDPHIIPIYEAGEASGVLFIAMRLVHGGDLRGVLAQEGPLPPARAAGFISPVASALDAAHRAGLVHRDIKPANILVDTFPDRPEHVYLSDFGVSKGAMTTAGLTGAGQFLGTPDYSAPEQIRGLDVDGRADQYALACVAYQLLTGVVPFERDQGMAVLLAHVSESPPSLGSRRPDLAGPADQVLARAMAKSPEKRYGSCRQFADALRGAFGLAPYYTQGSAIRPGPLADSVDSGGGGVTVDPEGGVTVDSVPAAPPSAEDAPVVTAVSPDPATAVAAGGTASTVNVPVTGPEPTSGPPARRRRLLAIGLVAAVIVAAGVVVPLELGSSARTGSTPPSAGPTASPSQGPTASRSGGFTAFQSFSRVATLNDSTPPSGDVTSVAFSPSGATLAAANVSADLWNVATRHLTTGLSDSGGSGADTVAFSSDGETLAVADTNTSIYIWSVAAGKQTAVFTNPNNSYLPYVAISPDGALVAIPNSNGHTYLWNTRTKKLATTLTDPGSNGVTSVAFSPDGTRLATGDLSGSAYLWTVATGKLAATFTDPNGSGVNAVAFSRDGTRLATGDVDGSAYLFTVATGKVTATLTGPNSKDVNAVAFSPDGTTVGVADQNGHVYLWIAATARLAETLTDPQAKGANSVAFSPNGEMLAVADYDGSVYLWQRG